MKIKTVVPILLLLLVVAVPVSAADPLPNLAEQFYGTATASGQPLPVGAEIYAVVNNINISSFIITEPGKIGGAGAWDSKFLVSAANNGDSISFYVAGCGYAPGTVSYSPGNVQQLTLTFTGTPIIYYPITKTPSEHGTYNVSSETAQAGDTVTVTATPESGYKFDKLAVAAQSGVTVSVSETSFTMPASAVTLTVTFTNSGEGGGYTPINPGIPVASGPITYGGYTNIDPLSAFGILYASGLSFSGDPGYISAIDGMAEKYYGGLDGWMFAINGVAPMTTCGNALVPPGGTLIWYYSKDMNAPIKESPKYIKFKLASDGKTFTMTKSGSSSPFRDRDATKEQELLQEKLLEELGKNIVPASPYTIDEACPIPKDGIVTLETIEQIKEVKVPLSLINEHPDAVLIVTEGSETALALPSNADAGNVVGVFEISVVDADGKKIPVTSPGSFTLKQTVPAGKTLVVGHQKSNGKWENCDVTDVGSNEWVVTYTSLSPFVSYLLNDGEENPFLTVESSVMPTVRPTFKSTANPKEQPKSPHPLFAVFMGMLCAGLILSRRI